MQPMLVDLRNLYRQLTVLQSLPSLLKQLLMGLHVVMGYSLLRVPQSWSHQQHEKQQVKMRL